MADAEILPDWAARYVQDNLSDHMHIVNVLPIDKGPMAGAYLMNTSKGAVLVQKGRLGEAQHWFMPMPGEHVTFACDRCGERMELVDPEVPRVIYCSACGERHFLVIQDGDLKVLKDESAASAGPAGGFVHDDHTLYRKKSGSGFVYFFSKTKPRSGRPCDLPAGHRVTSNERTGVPELVEADRCVAHTARGDPCSNKAQSGSDRCARHG